MKWSLIAVVTCAVVFYIRFFWAMQNDLRHRSKNRSDIRWALPYRPLVKVDISDVLAHRRSYAASSRARKQ